MSSRSDGQLISSSTHIMGFRLILVVLVLSNLVLIGSAESATPRSLRSYVCRVTNQVAGVSNLGSGTLIHKTPDSREGLVLTCAHLFREGNGKVLVQFADGHRHQATLIDVDTHADLAALAIAHPTGSPAVVAPYFNSQANLHACGFGPRGLYRCAIGPHVGRAEDRGQASLLIGDPVRSGDSGGGVFDEQGRLVAVIWGESQGVTYASFGKPLRAFISRVLGRKTSLARSCPDGICPRRPEFTSPLARDGALSGDSRWADFQKQLNELRAQKQDRGDYLLRSELPSFGQFALSKDVRRLEAESDTRHAHLLEQLNTLSGRSTGRALGKAAVGLLGLSGPAGWAIVAASGIGGWLIGRRVKRKLRGAGGRRRRRFRE